MEGLEAEYTKVQVNYDNAARRFGEDPTKVPSGEFFALMSSVVDMIAVAMRENELQARSEERRRKREAQEKKRQEEKARKKLEQEEASRPPEKDLGGMRSRRGLMTSLSRTPTMRKSRERETKGTQMDIMLKRREMIAVGSQEMDDSDTEWEDEDDGAVSQAYEQIKTERVGEAVLFRNMSKIQDAKKREAARGKLPYQKSTIGRQPSMGSSNRTLGGGNPAMTRQVSAARQASHLRAYSAARQASTIGRGLGRNPSVLRASAGGVGMSRRGGFSTENFDPRMSRHPSGFHRREASEGPDTRRGAGATDPRKQFSRLKSTAFIG